MYIDWTYFWFSNEFCNCCILIIARCRSWSHYRKFGTQTYRLRKKFDFIYFSTNIICLLSSLTSIYRKMNLKSIADFHNFYLLLVCWMLLEVLFLHFEDCAKVASLLRQPFLGVLFCCLFWVYDGQRQFLLWIRFIRSN